MGRVFVLGAGFSASAGLPTITRLFERMLALENSYLRDPEDYEDLRRNVQFFYPETNLSDPRSYPNFEEFLSLLEISRDFQEDSDVYPGSTRNFSRYYNRTLSILCHTIATLQNEVNYENESHLRTFVENLTCNDAIISFNWDTLIERQAESIQKQIDLDGRQGLTSLLKLHGSLSWVWVERSIIPSDYLVPMDYSSTEEGQLYRSANHSLLDTWPGLDRPPSIITPIARKTPLDTPYIRRLWDIAMEVIVNASVVYAIGYSLPSPDYHARAMLRNAIDAKERRDGTARLVVIDPDKSAADRFARYVHRGCESIVQRFSAELIDADSED